MPLQARHRKITRRDQRRGGYQSEGENNKSYPLLLLDLSQSVSNDFSSLTGAGFSPAVPPKKIVSPKARVKSAGDYSESRDNLLASSAELVVGNGNEIDIVMYNERIEKVKSVVNEKLKNKSNEKCDTEYWKILGASVAMSVLKDGGEISDANSAAQSVKHITRNKDICFEKEAGGATFVKELMEDMKKRGCTRSSRQSALTCILMRRQTEGVNLLGEIAKSVGICSAFDRSVKENDERRIDHASNSTQDKSEHYFQPNVSNDKNEHLSTVFQNQKLKLNQQSERYCDKQEPIENQPGYQDDKFMCNIYKCANERVSDRNQYLCNMIKGPDSKKSEMLREEMVNHYTTNTDYLCNLMPSSQHKNHGDVINKSAVSTNNEEETTMKAELRRLQIDFAAKQEALQNQIDQQDAVFASDKIEQGNEILKEAVTESDKYKLTKTMKMVKVILARIRKQAATREADWGKKEKAYKHCISDLREKNIGLGDDVKRLQRQAHRLTTDNKTLVRQVGMIEGESELSEVLPYCDTAENEVREKLSIVLRANRKLKLGLLMQHLMRERPHQSNEEIKNECLHIISKYPYRLEKLVSDMMNGPFGGLISRCEPYARNISYSDDESTACTSSLESERDEKGIRQMTSDDLNSKAITQYKGNAKKNIFGRIKAATKKSVYRKASQ